MSIYKWLQLAQAGEAYESNCPLPDHADLGDNASAWVPGAYEALLMRSDYSISRFALLNYLLARTVRKQMLTPSSANQAKEEAKLLKTGALAIVDPLISHLSRMNVPRDAMRTEALRLACESSKRELVKVGMALLGQSGEPSDAEILLTLGRHEEFTFFAAPALRALLGADAVNDALLPLADQVDGWGKTAILYELNYSLEGSAAPEYLLRRGCANRLGLALNANLCATKGQLAERLEAILAAGNPGAAGDEGSTAENAADAAAPIDAELCTGICEILWGLTEFDGIHDSLNDYKHGIAARNAFVQLMKERPEVFSADARAAEIINRMK
ncbi:MAG: hypothetical protein II789_01585 [Clostridia bacterium]|nr:hypothetical protein [Clostridia bacterium]